jgi:hypothetical protein
MSLLSKMRARPNWGYNFGGEPPPLTLEESRRQLRSLWLKMYRRFGPEITRREFGVLSQKPSKADLALAEKLEWFERLDEMPKASVRRLVRELLTDGSKPGDSNFENLEKRIKNAKTHRAKIEAEFAVLLLPTSEKDRAAKYQVAKKRDISKA